MLLPAALRMVIACVGPDTNAVANADAPAVAPEDAPTTSRLAVGGFGGISFGLYPIPSGELAGFVGGTLPARSERRPGGPTSDRVALGYRGGIAVGDAEFAPGRFAHRHHLALMALVGERRRGLIGAGVGVKAVGRQVGWELALQVGHAVPTRTRGAVVFGGELRYGAFACRGCAKLPYPQFGVFVGWLQLPGRRPEASAARDGPRRGLGLLIPGAVLLAAFGAVVIADVVIFGSSGSDGCHGCLPLTVYALPILAPGVPLTAVGAIRNARYREWRDARALALRPTGFTVRF